MTMVKVNTFPSFPYFKTILIGMGGNMNQNDVYYGEEEKKADASMQDAGNYFV